MGVYKRILINKLLTEFKGVFEQQHGLPSSHSHDHSIVLNEGTQFISARPYHYTYYQQAGTEKIVAESLQSGDIRPSSSPSTLPILLVRKVNGSWQLCIDYRLLIKKKMYRL